MNEAHIHLLINHVPIIGVIIGAVVLISGFTLKNGTVKKTALGIFMFAALSAGPAFLSGEGAEELVENIPGISESHIEAHEEIAEVFIWIIAALGILSLLAFLVEHFKSNYAKWLYLLVAIMVVITLVAAAQVGTTGGEIRHTEIRGV